MTKSAEISRQLPLPVPEVTTPESRWPIIGLTPEGRNKKRKMVRIILPEIVDESRTYPFIARNLDNDKEVQLLRKKDIRLAYEALGINVLKNLRQD